MNTKNESAAVPPGITVVTMPGEVAFSNAEHVHAELFGALLSRIGTVVVDLTATTFCDTAGVGEIVRAYQQAKERGIELRLVVPHVLTRIFTLTALDRLISLYPTLSAALAADGTRT